MKPIKAPLLFGPAPIQAPTPWQAIADNYKPTIKDNSEVLSGFDYIKALLCLQRLKGKYFESLSETAKTAFSQALKQKDHPRARMSRAVDKFKQLSHMEDTSKAYEEFVKFMFGATNIAGML